MEEGGSGSGHGQNRVGHLWGRNRDPGDPVTVNVAAERRWRSIARITEVTISVPISVSGVTVSIAKITTAWVPPASTGERGGASRGIDQGLWTTRGFSTKGRRVHIIRATGTDRRSTIAKSLGERSREVNPDGGGYREDITKSC